MLGPDSRDPRGEHRDAGRIPLLRLGARPADSSRSCRAALALPSEPVGERSDGDKESHKDNDVGRSTGEMPVMVHPVAGESGNDTDYHNRSE